MKKEEVIKIKNLGKTFESKDGKIKYNVLKDINLSIQTGDFCIIYGPSGSGKSTLLHHIIGLETPTTGEVIVRGTNVTKLSNEERAIFRSEKFGTVYQMWYWIKSLNVVENVAMPLLIKGMSKKEAIRKALRGLEDIGMNDYAKKYSAELSGGEQQKVLMARALVNNPWIIIADEPTGNLDTHSADQVMQMLQKLNVIHGRTIIMVTHNLIYLPMASKKIALKDGMVVSTSDQEFSDEIKTELRGVI